MKLFAVIIRWEDDHFRGVFSSEEKANEYWNKWLVNRVYNEGEPPLTKEVAGFEVIPVEVDDYGDLSG